MSNKKKISKKILLIVMDGLGDEPIPELGNKTPLESAQTPHLNQLAKEGICGLVKPYLFKNQKKPDSDISHLAIFGYDPQKYYLGRGPYEAVGIGLELQKGDIALRVNFATVDNNFKIIDRRAGRIDDTHLLINSLKGIEINGVKFILKKSFGHRAVLVLHSKNKKLSDKISNGDPKKVGLKVKEILPLNKEKSARFTAQILNEYLKKAHLILKNHLLNKNREQQGLLPANYLLVRGAGKMKETPSFQKKYGLRACCIAGGALYKGIAKILGMDLINVRGANGFVNTNLKGKILAAMDCLKKYDFVFLHIKATDSLAEDGNFMAKKEFIEKIDSHLRNLIKLNNALIIITADHSTSSLLKSHCKKPVPILIFGREKDNVEEFSEKACKKGKLGILNQLEIMKKIL